MLANQGKPSSLDQPVARPRRVRAGNREPLDTSKGNVVGKALEGVRVLDMTHVQSGASCAQILAWMGADVVKLEAPGGDILGRSQAWMVWLPWAGVMAVSVFEYGYG